MRGANVSTASATLSVDIAASTIIDSGEYIVSVGALDDQDGFVLDSEIFVDEQPPFYAFANETTKMTGAEVFAMFAPAGDGDGDGDPA